MRVLVPADEPAFQGLLRRVYGDTYSYRTLYRAGGVTALITSGRAALWGDFADDDRELISHTGFFWKDPRRDYVESGMSLRHPNRRPSTPDDEVWRRLFEWLGGDTAYLHQQTTTYHPLAQRYAERHMRALPAGFVIDYAVGEKLEALTTPAGPMHAVMMTSQLAPAHPQPAIAIPSGPWSEFVASAAGGLGLVAAIEEVPAAGAVLLDATPIEHNRDLGLVRRGVARTAGVAATPVTDARVDLVHVPLDDRAGAVAALAELGYVPVGLRPHATRPHEIVMQHLPGARRAYAAAALGEARLGSAAAALADAWRAGCARAM
jgi:hypothetical protein